MAKRKETPQTEPIIRQMTICKKGYARENHRYIYFPELHLRGKWLRQTGFCIGQVIDIACEEGKLTITLAKEQRFTDSEREEHALADI